MLLLLLLLLLTSEVPAEVIVVIGVQGVLILKVPAGSPAAATH
jgi:hypothetical protein